MILNIVTTSLRHIVTVDMKDEPNFGYYLNFTPSLTS